MNRKFFFGVVIFFTVVVFFFFTFGVARAASVTVLGVDPGLADVTRTVDVSQTVRMVGECVTGQESAVKLIGGVVRHVELGKVVGV